MAKKKEFFAEVNRQLLQALAAEVEARSAQLAANHDEIDSMLSTTLSIDDFVDLEQLRRVVQQPPLPIEVHALFLADDTVVNPWEFTENPESVQYLQSRRY